MPGVVARSGNAQMVPQGQPGLLCQHRTREDPTRFLPGFTPCFPLEFTVRSMGRAGGTINTFRGDFQHPNPLLSTASATSSSQPGAPGWTPPLLPTSSRWQIPEEREEMWKKWKKTQEKCSSGTFINTLNIFLWVTEDLGGFKDLPHAKH